MLKIFRKNCFIANGIRSSEREEERGRSRGGSEKREKEEVGNSSLILKIILEA